MYKIETAFSKSHVMSPPLVLFHDFQDGPQAPEEQGPCPCIQFPQEHQSQEGVPGIK